MTSVPKGGAVGPFVDTNVLLYLISADEAKANRAEQLLAQGIVLGVQVLNEFVNVTRRKYSLSWDEVTDILGMIRQQAVVRPLTASIHDDAIEISRKHSLSWFDSLIVAAALDGGCSCLYTEDMHHGLKVTSPSSGNAVTLTNPFVTA